MRLTLAAVLLLAFAACSDDARLCSEDPNCQPAGCGPSGCTGDVGGGRGGAGAGGGGGTAGAAGAGGSGGAAPSRCDEMCRFVYQQCGTVITGVGGRVLSFDECVDSCGQGIPSQAQAACVLASACFFAPCLEPVPAGTCDQVCEKVYATCEGALVVDGRLVSASDCELVCPYGLTNRQASCIVGAACDQWVHCAP